MHMDVRVLELTGVVRQILLADLDYHRIHFDKVYRLDRIVSRQLLDDSAVADADDKYILRVRVNRHRHVRYHLVVYELVSLGQHYIAVEHEHTPELHAVKHIYTLIFTLRRKQLLLDSETEFYIFRMIFTEP